MERKFATWLIAVLAIMILVVAFSYIIDKSTGNVVKDQKETIKIGVVFPLSGSVGFIGEGGKNALMLAKENLKDTKYNYELIFEDSKIEPKETATVTSKLINVDGVDAIISISSGTGNIVSPMTQEAKVLHIGIASDPNIAIGEFNFIHWTSPQEENRVFVQELKHKGIKKVAVIELNQQGTKATIDELQNQLKGTDIQITTRELFNFGDKDFKTIIEKASKTQPDIYLLSAFSPELEIIGKQLKEKGIEEVTAIEAFELTEQPELFEGKWYVQAADPTNSFVENYKSKYDKSFAIGGPNSYDSLNLIVNAFENARKDNKKPTTEEARIAFTKIKNFDGALGKLDVLSNRLINSKAVVRQIIDGKPVTISASKLN